MTNRELLLQAVETLPERIVDHLLTWVKQIPQEAPAQTLEPVFTVPELNSDPQATPIWQLAEQATAHLSDQDWQAFPTDLASNFDAYQQIKHES